MNSIQRDRTHSRAYKAHLEFLDARVVPSTMPGNVAVVAADLAVARAHLNAVQQIEDTATGESAAQIRHENRMIKLAEQRVKTLERKEAVLERRDAQLARTAARNQFTAAVQPQILMNTVVVTNAVPSTTGSSTSTSSQAATDLSSSGSGTATTVGSTGTTAPTAPVTPAPVPTTGATTTPTTTPAAGSTIPANVSAALISLYDDYQNGALPASGPGQIEVQGSSVGVQIRDSDPSDFNTMVADAESLGLQVTVLSAAYDTVVGLLPITQLPAVAQLPATASVTPVYNPYLN